MGKCCAMHKLLAYNYIGVHIIIFAGYIMMAVVLYCTIGLM